jgi:general secretion pathway protein J
MWSARAESARAESGRCAPARRTQAPDKGRARHHRTPVRQPGFTLIEVLVALLIFAIIAAIGYRTLTVVLEARHRVATENHHWRALAYAVSRIETDLAAIVDRPVHDPSGPIQAASLIGTPAPAQDDPPLAFTREGEPDASGLPGAPLRVGYRLREGVLERLTWPVLDAAPRVRPQASALLEGVVALEWVYLGADGVQGAVWPRGQANGGATRGTPDAVSVRMTLANGDQISRLIALAPPGIR